MRANTATHRNISRASCHAELFVAAFRWLGDGMAVST